MRQAAVAAVRPGVVGPALDEHVAGTHERLVLVQQRPHLALEDDRVVERRRLVEPEVPRIAALGRGLLVARAADLAEQLRHVDVVVRAVRREVGDAQDRAVRRRRHGGTRPAGAVSSSPSSGAGVPSVVHRTVATSCGIAGGALRHGAGPSLRMTERPSARWPVTIRRTGGSVCSGSTETTSARPACC